MASLTMLILTLLLGACKLTFPIDLSRMMMTHEDLKMQMQELERGVNDIDKASF